MQYYYLIKWTFMFIRFLFRNLVFVLCRYVFGPLITPRGHRVFGDYRDTEAYHSLAREDYHILPMWGSNAVARIQKRTQ